LTRKGREEAGRFLAEGPKIVEEGFRAGLGCHALLISSHFPAGEIERMLSAGYVIPFEEIMAVSEKQFQDMSGTTTPQGILAEFGQPEMPDPFKTKESGSTLLVLHEVQEPGNVGTAIRTAAGLGAGGVVLTKGCADPWNPKAVRAAAGALFKIPVWSGFDPGEARDGMAALGYTFWVAAADGGSLYDISSVPRPLALVVGNEARGVGSVWEEAPGAARVSIPMHHGVESLNVGTAVAAILAVVGAGLGFQKPPL
jgi:TrmH family RNA methyltransferase